MTTCKFYRYSVIHIVGHGCYTKCHTMESCLWQRCVGIQKLDKSNLPQGQPKQSFKNNDLKEDLRF